MDTDLIKIISELLGLGKGILAADESSGTIKKRFEKAGIEDTEENHRRYRQMLFGTEDIEKYLSGVIMFDETVKQRNNEGVNFCEYLTKRGIIPGIKVDEGKEPFTDSPNESVTKGIEGLPQRLKEYKEIGLKFAKWRAEFVITPDFPSEGVLVENAKRMAEYAKICQDNGFVPIVEPEVVRDGPHDIKKCEEITKKVLVRTFSELERKEVNFKEMLLKVNMVTSGKDFHPASGPREVAQATFRVLDRVVRPEIPGIVFLSGGQTPEEATANLNEINKSAMGSTWQFSFSFARALQSEALEIWKGRDENVPVAQEAFLNRLRLVSLARGGKL